MCSGCGRCGKVETGCHSVVTSVATALDLVQVASLEKRASDQNHPGVGTRVPDLVILPVPSARQ